MTSASGHGPDDAVGRTGHRTRAVRSLVAILAAATLLAGCATSNPNHRQAEAVDDGVQATGVIDGSRVAISRGVPEVVFGDCDPGVGVDADICWVARTIDGLSIAFVIENPALLAPDVRLDVVDSTCEDCDDVTDGVVVDLRVDGETRRATTGWVEVAAVPGERAAAAFDLGFPDGDALRGSFNVRELRPEEQ